MAKRDYRKYFSKSYEKSAKKARINGIMCFVFIVIAILAGAFAVLQFANSPDSLTVHSATGSHRFIIEVADEPQEQAKGLMFRQRLDPNGGMLFVFPAPQPVAFWMKDTFVSLDMVFIDESRRIVGIAKMTRPQTLDAIPSPVPVIAVLEILGGRSDALGISVGDTVDF